jgi:hypothetical protein
MPPSDRRDKFYAGVIFKYLAARTPVRACVPGPARLYELVYGRKIQE